MSLEENIRLAVAAYNYTKKIVHKGADNREDDVHAANGFPGRLPSGVHKWLPDNLRPTLTPEAARQQRVTLDRITDSEFPVTRELEIAKVVADSGIGRCGEQSIVAFTYLLRHSTSVPFGVVNIDKGNHDFVVIGAQEAQVKGVQLLTPAPHWPMDAVVLDCWAKCHFVVAERWTSEMPRILKQTAPAYDKPAIFLVPRIFHKWADNPAFGTANPAFGLR